MSTEHPKVTGVRVIADCAKQSVRIDLDDGSTVHAFVGIEAPAYLVLRARMHAVDEALGKSRDPHAFGVGTRARAVAELRWLAERVHNVVAPGEDASPAELGAAVEELEARAGRGCENA